MLGPTGCLGTGKDGLLGGGVCIEIISFLLKKLRHILLCWEQHTEKMVPPEAVYSVTGRTWLKNFLLVIVTIINKF